MSQTRGSRPVEMHETAGADVTIGEVHADGGPTEHVTIVNRGTVDQPLTDWAIASLHGLGVFSFPAGTVLPAGGMLRILSGEGARAVGRGELLWTQESIWSNRSDTVLLFDLQGHEVARLAYPRPTIRENRVPKRKVLIRERAGYRLADWDDVDPPANVREQGL